MCARVCVTCQVPLDLLLYGKNTVTLATAQIGPCVDY